MKFIAREFCLVEPYKFAVRERDIEKIPKGFLLLRPMVAGICGSEMLYFKGEKEPEKLRRRLPMCLLHEGVAEVVEKGEGTRLNVGTKVVVNPMVPCGECSACKRNRENLCQNARYMAATADGLARTLFLYPENRVLLLPQGLDLEVAALTEPFSVALSAIEEAEINRSDVVAVIGDGAVGYLLTLAVSYVSEVPRERLYMIGIVDEKLALVNDFASTINSMREAERLNKLCGAVDVSIEAVGGKAHRTTIKTSIDLLSPGGKCVLVGISKGEIPVEITKIVNKGLTLKGSTRSRMEHYVKALDLLRLSEVQDKVKRIISAKRFIIRDVDDLTEAFKYADTEEGEAKTKPGRVMVHFPPS